MKVTNADQVYQTTIRALDGFNPRSQGTELYMSEYLDGRDDILESDRNAIIEIFYDCVQYSKLMKVVVDSFLNTDGIAFKKSQFNMYRIIAYLAYFRLDDLGMGKFHEFVETRELRKMYRFLNFALAEDNINGWIRDEWCHIYSTDYVDGKLIVSVKKHLPELQELLNSMKRKLDALDREAEDSASGITKKPPTQPVPFNLTESRPRSVPIPEMIPVLAKPKPIPKATYEKPREESVLEEVRINNRKRAENILLEASQQAFACANPNPSRKTIQRLDEIIEEEKKKLKFESHRAKPLPITNTVENQPVRLNAATILREEKLYKKQEQNELTKLRMLEEGFGNSVEFTRWQTSMRNMDEQQQLIAIEKRRLAGKLSYEEAILSRAKLVEDNMKKAEEIRKEAKALMMEYAIKQLEDEEEMQQRRREILDSHENRKEILKELQKYKATIVQSVKEENKKLMEQALEDAEKEMRQKMDLIREIRAMEMVPVTRFKPLDPTEIAGHGLMCEMSLAELRARLFTLKQKQASKQEEKRDEIIAHKQAREQDLMDALTHISQVRSENTRTAVLRQQARKERAHKKIFVEDEQLKNLERQVEERQRQRKKLQQAASKPQPGSISAQRLRDMTHEKQKIENNRWKQLEQAREKVVKLGARPQHSALAKQILKQNCY